MIKYWPQPFQIKRQHNGTWLLNVPILARIYIGKANQLKLDMFWHEKLGISIKWSGNFSHLLFFQLNHYLPCSFWFKIMFLGWFWKISKIMRYYSTQCVKEGITIEEIEIEDAWSNALVKRLWSTRQMTGNDPSTFELETRAKSGQKFENLKKKNVSVVRKIFLKRKLVKKRLYWRPVNLVQFLSKFRAICQA